MKSRYKQIASQIKQFFSGEKHMTDTTVVKAVNYTDRMVEEMVSAYMSAPTAETVAQLSAQLGKPTRSIVAKLVREGVYVAAQRVTKTGAPVIRKSELVAQLQNELGVELPSLEKASKQDLEALVAAITSRAV
jgi:hypothetical protein